MTEGQLPTGVAAPVAVPAVKSTVPVKLTPEEEAARYQFIGKCVDNGINFPSNMKFGVQGALSVQDMCNASVGTLQTMGAKINKEKDAHDPEFSSSEELKIAGLPADQWLSFLRLTIRKKNWLLYAATKRAEAKGLKAEIAAGYTPDEKRKLAEEKLKAIDSQFTEE